MLDARIQCRKVCIVVASICRVHFFICIVYAISETQYITAFENVEASLLKIEQP